MQKECFWHIKADGTLHEVTSLDKGNSFAVCVDEEAEIRRQEKQSKILTIFSGLVPLVLGLFAMWMWTAMQLSGQEFFFGAFGPVFAALVSLAWVVLTIYGIRKKGV